MRVDVFTGRKIAFSGYNSVGLPIDFKGTRTSPNTAEGTGTAHIPTGNFTWQFEASWERSASFSRHGAAGLLTGADRCSMFSRLKPEALCRLKPALHSYRNRISNCANNWIRYRWHIWCPMSNKSKIMIEQGCGIAASDLGFRKINCLPLVFASVTFKSCNSKALQFESCNSNRRHNKNSFAEHSATSGIEAISRFAKS